jgi:hypothetical protein
MDKVRVLDSYCICQVSANVLIYTSRRRGLGLRIHTSTVTIDRRGSYMASIQEVVLQDEKKTKVREA